MITSVQGTYNAIIVVIVIIGDVSSMLGKNIWLDMSMAGITQYISHKHENWPVRACHVLIG